MLDNKEGTQSLTDGFCFMVARPSLPSVDSWISDRLATGLNRLCDAARYSTQFIADGPNFAVEIDSLKNAGLANCDLRWLIFNSFVVHVVELTLPGDAERSFRPGGAMLTDASCFQLTDKGLAFAEQTLQASIHRSSEHPTVSHFNNTAAAEFAIKTESPNWDEQRRELSLCGRIVKRFRLPSPNQTAVLSAFQEESWIPRIDDPLPPTPGIDPKRRLSDTIRNLNRSHQLSAMRFAGDGSGQGVLWETV